MLRAAPSVMDSAALFFVVPNYEITKSEKQFTTYSSFGRFTTSIS